MKGIHQEQAKLHLHTCNKINCIAVLSILHSVGINCRGTMSSSSLTQNEAYPEEPLGGALE